MKKTYLNGAFVEGRVVQSNSALLDVEGTFDNANYRSMLELALQAKGTTENFISWI